MSAVSIGLVDAQFYMRNVRTRMPFKYGVAVLTSVPILHVVARCRLGDGTEVAGVAADILPPKWFDKAPAKDYADNVEDLLFAARAARAAYMDAGRAPDSFFEIWQAGYAETLAAGDGRGLNRLTSAHGSTLMERALIDALGRGMGATYFELIKSNSLGLDLGAIHAELRGVDPAAVLGSMPLPRVHVRHTVGLADPIATDEIRSEERLDDGLPQSLEEYIERQGLSHFKVKVDGDLVGDIERLTAIAALLDRSDAEYCITLDGNEQYRDMENFIELVTGVETGLPRFYESILYIEQPLERSIALDPALEDGIRAVGARRPVLIDESDEELDTFRRAIDLGYRGVSSKACKGLVKALANLALAQRRSGSFLSAEGLMNLPVVPLHQELTHVAAVGIGHVERNGHGSLYAQTDGLVALDIRSGEIDLRSLQVPGLGIGLDLPVEEMVPLEQWEFESLA